MHSKVLVLTALPGGLWEILQLILEPMGGRLWAGEPRRWNTALCKGEGSCRWQLGDFKVDGSPQVTFLRFQSQSSWAWAIGGRWRSSTRRPSPLGLCCCPGWPTSSRTGAGCSWPSPCPSFCSSSATGTVSPWGPVFPTARAVLPAGPGLPATHAIWGAPSWGSPHSLGGATLSHPLKKQIHITQRKA